MVPQLSSCVGLGRPHLAQTLQPPPHWLPGLLAVLRTSMDVLLWPFRSSLDPLRS